MRDKNIVPKPTSYTLSAEQKKLLDTRERESLSGKNSEKNWEEIKASVKSRKK